jgi:hypothetical protein
VSNGASQQFPFGPDLDPDTRRLKALMAGPDQIAQAANICARGQLQNKGNGPAKDVLVYLNTRPGEGEDDAFRLSRPMLISGLVGAEEETAVDVAITERDVMPQWAIVSIVVSAVRAVPTTWSRSRTPSSPA